MVEIMSCDHHGEHWVIPSTRSRAVMLEQLQAAAGLAEAMRMLADDAMPEFDVNAGARRLLAEPYLTIGMRVFLDAWEAYRAWMAVAPSEEDLSFPPYEPPAEVRVPPDGPTVEPDGGSAPVRLHVTSERPKAKPSDALRPGPENAR